MLMNGGVQPWTVSFPRGAALPAAIRPGQAIQTTVQGARGMLSVNMGGIRIPLEGASALEPGQLVRLEILAGEGGYQIRVSPLPTPEIPASPSQTLTPLLRSVLDSLGAPPSADSATLWIPAHLTASAPAIRQILLLFLAQDALGSELRELVALLQQAASAGAIPPDNAAAIAAWLAPLTSPETAGLRDLLKSLSRGVASEARLARALDTGTLEEALELLRNDLRSEVSRLRGQEAFTTWLRGQGQLRRFSQTVERILDRLDGAHLQNLRSFEQPYIFFELPFPPESGFEHAQVHLFGDAPARGKRIEKNNATIVFDLSLSRLGALWIMLRITAGRCQCRIQATSTETIAALEKARPDLADAIARAGFAGSHFEFTLWDGDRLRETTALLKRFTGFTAHV